MARRRLLLGLFATGLMAPLVGCAGASQAGGARPPGSPAAPAPNAAPPKVVLADPQAGAREEPKRLRLPPRSPGAETGSAFLARTAPLGNAKFQDAVFDAVAEGNVPPFLRLLAPVRLAGAGDATRGVVYVLRDYLAIGSDEDFVRMPMTASTAQRIAILTGSILPTRKLVDAIYEQSEAKLPPSFIEGGPTLAHRLDYAVHHRELEAQRARLGLALGVLTAGDKKDIVLTNRLTEREDRVAIYGWHKDDGRPIQPLSIVHGRRYADYSHGVRLVDGTMSIDGDETRVAEVLRDPHLADLLSDEGPLEVLAYPTHLPVRPNEPSKPRKKRRGKRTS